MNLNELFGKHLEDVVIYQTIPIDIIKYKYNPHIKSIFW